MKYIGSKQISEAGPQAEHLEQTKISFYVPFIFGGEEGCLRDECIEALCR